MKKRITKALVLATLLITMATSLIACGVKECDWCSEKAKCETINFNGQKVDLCEDCRTLKECDICGEMGKCNIFTFFGQEIDVCEDCQ